MYFISNTNSKTSPSVLTRAATFAVVPGIIAGAVATGPVAGMHHPGLGSAPHAPTYTLPGYDRTDAPHSDPVGEFVSIANPESGTARTMTVFNVPRT
jgi:hypothetical protein